MKKFLQIANVLALTGTIIINYLSNTGIFNNSTMATVSARYQNLFTPAAYAFSIWGLIYLALIAFSIYQARSLFSNTADDSMVLPIGGWFLLSCVANSSWVILWLYDYTGLSILVMLILFFSLLKIILNTKMELDDEPLRTIAFIWWPFCFYSGWITVALLANISAWLTKIHWSGWGLSEQAWAIIMIMVAGAVYIFMTWNRNMREYASIGIWALVAIAVPNWTRAPAVAWTALLMAILLFVNVSLHAYRNRKYSPWTWTSRHPVDNH